MSDWPAFLQRLNTRTTAWVMLALIFLGWGFTLFVGYSWADRMREEVRSLGHGVAEIYSVREGDFYNPAHWLAPPVTRLVYDQTQISRAFPKIPEGPQLVFGALSIVDIDEGWEQQWRLYDCTEQRLTVIGQNERMPETIVEFLRDQRREWIPLQALPADQPIHRYYCPE